MMIMGTYTTDAKVKITLPDGTEYVGPPLDEPCDECGVPAGVPCLPDPGEYEEDDASQGHNSPS